LVDRVSTDRRPWARRFNTGAVCIEGRDARGRRTRRFVRYAFPGCSDILGQLASGHFLACEVKRPSTRPTPEQAAFLEQVRCNGGLACIARGVDDVQRALDGFFAVRDRTTAEQPLTVGKDRPESIRSAQRRSRHNDLALTR
jgi:hypothetical protein